MYQVKLFNRSVTGQSAEIHKFKLWQEVRAFIKSVNGAHCILVIHPNGGLVFPDSLNGESIKSGILL